MFVGRENEIAELDGLFKKRTGSLVICKGRRRIGKSRLIQEFAKRSARRYLEFQGLAPRPKLTNQDQLDEFARLLSLQTTLPVLKLDSWSQAFSVLANQLNREKTVLLLDEISWMAKCDPDFVGQVKIAWDTLWSRHKRLVVVLCGSVSSWIDENILASTGFVGRISLQLTLRELPLHDCIQFWGKRHDRVSSHEKLQMLAVTGGVPRYLEEIRQGEPAENTIRRLCFSEKGILYLEFDQIFNEVFSLKSSMYREILEAIAWGGKSLSEIAKAINRERTGYLSKCLHDLELSGFIKRESVFKIGNRSPSRLHYFRISDNYVRFYLKYIKPVSRNIGQDLYDRVPLENIIAWDTIIGFQFENLVLNNYQAIVRLLNIDPASLISCAPYFQRKTLRHDACQIDLLIQTKGALYPCEIKCRKSIAPGVIHEVQEKIRRLKAPHHYSIRPVLIYEGELAPGTTNSGWFDALIRFGDLLVQVPQLSD